MLPQRLDDALQITAVSDGRDPDLREPITQRRREFLLAVISTRVHRRDELEVVVGLDCWDLRIVAAAFREHDRATSLKNTVEALKNGIIGQ